MVAKSTKTTPRQSSPTCCVQVCCRREVWWGLLAGLSLVIGLQAVGQAHFFTMQYQAVVKSDAIDQEKLPTIAVVPLSLKFDKEIYDRKLLMLANNGLLKLVDATTTSVVVASTTASTTRIISKSIIPPTASAVVASNTNPWPVKAAYPNIGALLPFNRVVAYYGNFYSVNMGILGEYPANEMVARLKTEVRHWEVADPNTPVIPAIDYIAMTAQGSPGADGMYRFRMPVDQIHHAIDLAAQVNGIVILEVQTGLANLQTEVKSLEPFLKLPQVHLAIDPEFHMVTGARPGTVIGTVDANDVNQVAEYLANIVKKYQLPPKILIVHRFTYAMVTHAKKIIPLPQVQIVMDMDGWGTPAKKFGTYNNVVTPDPVQFTGFKLFYKNDIKSPSTHMLTPEEVLKLSPQPSFIQYQ